MGQSILKENFSSFAGLDYRSHDANRDPKFLRQATNADILIDGSISSCRGYKGLSKGAGGAGLISHVWKKSGTRYEEAIAVDDNLRRLKRGVVTITYTGAETGRSFEIVPELVGSDYVFVCRIINGATIDLEKNLVLGVNEAAPYTITDLVADITALADFTCVLTSGDGAIPAAFIPNQTTFVDAGAGTAIGFYYWETIPCPTATPFATFWALRNSVNFENAALLSLGDLLFIATGHNHLYKYDGLSTYRAGMPEPTAPVYSASVAGTVPAGVHSWAITYEFIDNIGHVIESDLSAPLTRTVAAGGEDFTLTLPTLQASTGFETSGAIVVGNQVDVNTIAVDDGAGGVHSMKVGQVAYFYDGVSASYVEREILAVDVTAPNFSITVAGDAVNVLDNGLISANLRINLWRTAVGGVFYYLVQSFPNNSFAASITLDPNTGATRTDVMTDATLIQQAEYTEPVAGHGIPPANLKYLCSFNTLLIGADGSDTVNFSDFDGPEYWNSDFIVRSASNEPVTAIAGTREVLVVFKKDEAHVVRGSLPESRYTQELLANAMGCDSHQSICYPGGAIWYYSAAWGIRRILSSGIPESVSYRIEPLFKLVTQEETERIAHKRVCSVVVPSLESVFYFLPCETVVGGAHRTVNDNSLILVADYSTQFSRDAEGQDSFPSVAWRRWRGKKMIGGAIDYEGELLFMERRYGDVVGAIEFILNRYLNTGSAEDLCDHGQPMEWMVESGWVALDSTEILKKFIRATIHSFALDFAPSFTAECSTELNFVNGLPHSRKTLVFGGATGGSSGWGTWPWDAIPWGEAIDTKKVFPFLPSISNAIKLVFEASLYKEQPVVSGWTIEAVPAYQPHIKAQNV